MQDTRYKIEEPTTVEDHRGMGGTVTTHPAYGQIGVSRVSGRASLYDSDFDHNAFMTITIQRSQLTRSLSNDWHFARGELIQVALSEAQWATFVSSPNVGSGVPCTIQHIQGERVPQLPPPAPRTKQFGAEVVKQMQAHLAQIDEALADIDSLGLSKAKAEKVRAGLSGARASLTAGLPFIAEQFSEHMEKTVEKAKAEVHGYMSGAIQRAGLEALTGGTMPLQIAGPAEDEA